MILKKHRSRKKKTKITKMLPTKNFTKKITEMLPTIAFQAFLFKFLCESPYSTSLIFDVVFNDSLFALTPSAQTCALLNTHHPVTPSRQPPQKVSDCFPESIVSHGLSPPLISPPSVFPSFP